MNKYISVDVETGGIGGPADLLTAFFGIHDEDLNLIEELTIRLRPDSEDDFFSVSAKALEINKINLVEHFKVAKPKSEAGKELWEYLRRHSENGGNKLIPVGHNVYFDILKISDKLLGKKTLDAFVQYGVLDSGSIKKFMQLLKLLPQDLPGGLGKIMAHYGIEFQGEAHNERADALGSVDLIKRMRDEILSRMK